jgi:hypothetical protein
MLGDSFRTFSMLGTYYLEYSILFPCLVELMLLKIGMRVAKFFHFKSLPQSPFKVGNLVRERKENNKESPPNLSASCFPCKEMNPYL